MKTSLVIAAVLTCMANTGIKASKVASPLNTRLDTTRTYRLQDVQVNATRANRSTPMAFHNLTQQQIKEVNYGQDLPYLLSLTPSITITSDAGNGIGYTSMRVRGTDPTRINITVNGVPMNDAESNGLYWVNMGDMASSLQSIQIQRGVGTSTNGAGAFGASVNMSTECIGLKPFLGLDVSAGSYYSHKQTLRFGTGLLGEHWGIQGRLSNIGSKGYIDRASAKLNSYLLQAGYFSDNTVVKLITWNGTEETYHAWNYASKQEQQQYGRSYNSSGYMYTDDAGIRHYYRNQTDNYHQQSYQLVWNQLWGPHLNLNATLHYTKGQGYYDEYKANESTKKYGLLRTDAATGTLMGYTSDLTRQKKLDNDFYGMVAGITYDGIKGLTAILGGGWNKYVGDHFGEVNWVKLSPNNLQPNQEYYRNRAKKTDGNIYGKLNWNFFQGLSAYVDLQYRHVNYTMQDPTDKWGHNLDGRYIIDDDFDFFNPKFGLNYHIDTHQRLYASYAIAHKEPTRNDYEDHIGTQLKAERLNDFEMGYKWEGQQFTAGINLYHMNYKDQFVLTGQLNEIGEPIARNSGRSYRMGVELEATWKPLHWLRWDANATLSHNRNKNWQQQLTNGKITNLGNTHIAYSPDAIANSILTLNYKGLKASLQSQYVGKQYLTNTDFQQMSCKDQQGNTTQETLMLADHLTTNMDFSYRLPLQIVGLKEAVVGLTLYNIFNVKFDNNGSAAPQIKQEADGRITAINESGVRDSEAAGFAPSAPLNWMIHLSLSF